MATTMVGQYCKLLKVISGIGHIQISHIQQPTITGLKRTIWYTSILDTKSGENVQSVQKFLQKPKMPPNVFIMYLQKMNEDITKKNPDASRQEIIRKISMMWQELDPEEKSRLAIERRNLYDNYKEKLKEYLENITPDQIKAEEKKNELTAAKRLKQVRKTLGMPKKPLGPFSYYISDMFHHRGDDVPVTIYFKHVISEWAKLNDSDREIYKIKAREAKEKYEEDIIKWGKEMLSLGRFDVVRKSLLQRLSKDKEGKKDRKNKVGFSLEEDEKKL